MANAGIDYGLGQANINHETGIRFGVISVHSLSDWVLGEAEPVYPETVEVECPECKTRWDTSNLCPDDMQTCPECGEESRYRDLDGLEPASWDYAANDPDYDTDYSESLNCVFVTRSQFYTFGRFCSPCAPGAVDLDSATEPEDGAKAYCFGHDWFEDGKAPYRVFRVADGVEVEPVDAAEHSVLDPSNGGQF